MAIFFIADLHLCRERPATTELFLDFLSHQVRKAERLYILGDLFEVWIGDDAPGAENHTVIEGLRNLTAAGTPIQIMHGNRDFLLGHGFEQQTGCTLINDSTVIDLYGTAALIMHGDTLCTDDIEYQEFRRQARDPKWQAQMLALAPERRLAIAKQYRTASQNQTHQKAPTIMDVNQHAVESVMHKHGVYRLIHGHTHHPAIHEFTLNGRHAQRMVLGDWHEHGSFLVCDKSGCRLKDVIRSS